MCDTDIRTDSGSRPAAQHPFGVHFVRPCVKDKPSANSFSSSASFFSVEGFADARGLVVSATHTDPDVWAAKLLGPTFLGTRNFLLVGRLVAWSRSLLSFEFYSRAQETILAFTAQNLPRIDPKTSLASL